MTEEIPKQIQEEFTITSENMKALKVIMMMMKKRKLKVKEKMKETLL